MAPSTSARRFNSGRKVGAFTWTSLTGQPQQNAYIEHFNLTVRYDCHAQHVFDTIEEVQEAATRWHWTFNQERTEMALGGITPAIKCALAANSASGARYKRGDYPYPPSESYLRARCSACSVSAKSSIEPFSIV